MPPGEPQVGIGAELDESACNRDQAAFATAGARSDRRVADIVQRLPAAWAAALGCKLRPFGEPPLDRVAISKDQRRVDVRARNRRIQREQALCAIGAAVGRRFDEPVRGGAEFERELLYALAKGVPRVKAVLARDDRLRVVEPELRAREIAVGMARERRQGAESRECVGVVGARVAQQIFRLVLELIETWALG